MDVNSQRKAPLILKKISVLKKEFPGIETSFHCKNIAEPSFIKNDILHSQSDDFMKGEYPDLTIVNRINLFDNSNRTTAKYISETFGNIEKTSDDVTKLIGQKNFNILFTALCSVTSKELRVRGILALLTTQRTTRNSFCQTDLEHPAIKVSSDQVNLMNTSSQTDETCSVLIQRLKLKKRRLIRSQLAPYVVKDLKPPEIIKKVVIEPHDFELAKKLIKSEVPILKNEYDQENGSQTQSLEVTVKREKIFLDDNNKTSIGYGLQLKENCIKSVDDLAHENLPRSINIKFEKYSSNETLFPELKLIVDEDSNISDISYGNISIGSCSVPNLLENPNALLNNIGKHTIEPLDLETTTLTMFDGSQVKLQGTPKDHFHIATAEILKYLSPEVQSKVIWYQAYIDWKFCLNRDEDSNLPLHLAVLNNDVDLLRRQCVVLKSRHESVDITARDNLTALQMSIFQDLPSCTAVLLEHGANPLLTDNEQRTSVHLAAEVSSDHLKAILSYCQSNARLVLHDNDLWKPELETKSVEEISQYLMSKICKLYDDQGYTPLMIASKLGIHTNVKMLLDMDPSTINLPMPNSGNTALYLVIASACLDLKNRLQKSKVYDDYVKTVEVLVKHGADPFIDNNFGSNVNLLLNEYNIHDLSLLVANTFVNVKYRGKETATHMQKDLAAFILVKDADGKLNMQEVKRTSKVNENSSVTKNTIPISKNKIVEPTKSSSEIKVHSNEVINKAAISQTKVDSQKINIPQYVKITPSPSCRVGAKGISIGKQGLNSKNIHYNNIIKITPKIFKISKLVLSKAVNVTNAKVTSTVTSSVTHNCNTQTQTCISKRSSLDKSREVPIKKQKRENITQ